MFCVSQNVFELLVLTRSRGNELERLMCALSLDVENIAPSSVGAISRDSSRVCSECLMTNIFRRVKALLPQYYPRQPSIRDRR